MKVSLVLIGLQKSTLLSLFIPRFGFRIPGRLRVVPHFSSGAIPEEKWGTTRSLDTRMKHSFCV